MKLKIIYKFNLFLAILFLSFTGFAEEIASTGNAILFNNTKFRITQTEIESAAQESGVEFNITAIGGGTRTNYDKGFKVEYSGTPLQVVIFREWIRKKVDLCNYWVRNRTKGGVLCEENSKLNICNAALK